MEFLKNTYTLLPLTSHQFSPARQLLQPRQPAIKLIAIPPISVRRVLLPDGLIPPPAGHRPRTGAAIPRQHQRARTAKRRTIPRTSDPPVIGGIDHRPAARARLVSVHERADPSHHGGLGEAVAGAASGGRVVFHVEHAGEGDAVGGPAAAVGEEEGRLGGAGGGGRWAREVVAAADEAGGCGRGVVGGEFGVDVGGAFGCLGGVSIEVFFFACRGVGKEGKRGEREGERK